MSEQPKFCVDCKFCENPQSKDYHKCNNPTVSPRNKSGNLATGVGTTSEMAYCSTERSHTDPESVYPCGSDGRLWEAKPIEAKPVLTNFSTSDFMKNRKLYLCPNCHQDVREGPHDGLGGKDCPRCGQGISWRKAARIKSKKSTNKRNIWT